MNNTSKQKLPITSIDQLDLDGTYTYADYITWQFNERVELILGKIFKMSPAPNTSHQRISRNLISLFDNYLQNKSCEVFSAPFDVRLPNPKLKNGKILNVVQPDLCVVCDPSMIDAAGCTGAPDLIVEILSDSTAKIDRKDKFDLYEQNKVKEYWIIDPYYKTLTVNILGENQKYEILYREAMAPEKIKVFILKDLIINLSKVFKGIS